MSEAPSLKNRGFVEIVSGDAIAGWCWDPDHPELRLDVDIRLDAGIIASKSASDARADLARAGFGDGKYGFRIPLLNKLSEDEQWRISVSAHSAYGSVILPRIARPPEVPTPTHLRAVAQRVPRCIVHIGTEKTGSTSLQAYLGKNREELRARGVLVPLSLSMPDPNGVINHTDLVSYSYDISTANEVRFHAGESPLLPSEIGKLRTARENTLLDEINDAIKSPGSECHTILFSCELLHNRLLLPEELVRLRNLLSAFADNVEVLVYARPQHEMAVSLFSTALGNGSTEKIIIPKTEGSPSHMRGIRRMYDFDALVTRWESAFGSGSVRVRIYCIDVVSDFAQTLGLYVGSEVGTSAPGQSTLRFNKNLSAVAQRVLLTLNGAMASAPDHEAKRLRDIVVDTLTKCFPGPSALPARSDAELFQAFFEESNGRLCARAFPEREHLFSLDFSRYPEAATPLQATTGEMAEAVMAIVRACDFRLF